MKKGNRLQALGYSFFTFLLLLLPSLLPVGAPYSLSPVYAAPNLDQVNQKVCNRFEENINHLAAIMDELKERQGITETRVAFGGSDTPIEKADYWINFAAEAIAYQRSQEYSSSQQLKYSLQTLRGKILTAKQAVERALDE